MNEHEKGEGPDIPPAGSFLLVRATLADLGARPLPATTPSYLSPDILLTGNPVEGVPMTVSVLVQNRGLDLARKVRARFWWCDPSLGVGGGGLHDVGWSTEVNVLPQNGEILACTTEWRPRFVNGGHECLFVEVTCASDPVTQPFRPDLDRHVAQRNVHVTQTAAAMMLTLNNPFRTSVLSRVAARSTRLFGVDPRALHALAPALDARSLAVQLLDPRTARRLIARGLLKPFDTADLSFGDVASIGEVIRGPAGEPSSDPDRESPPRGEGSPWDEFAIAEAELEPGGTATVDVSVFEKPGEGEIDVHHVVQLAGDAVIGGYAIVVLPE